MRSFEFSTAGRIIFGAGSIRETGNIARGLGSKVLVVGGGREAPARILEQIITDHKLESISCQIKGEPDLEVISEIVEITRKERCSCVAAVGGGSVLDAGKAAAALVPQQGSVMDYLEVIGEGKPLSQRPLPFIAIPTTAGTGSEVTRNAVLTSKSHRVKVSLRSYKMLPMAAIIDPELMLSMPPEVTAATGMDAFTQLVEPYVSNKANAFTDPLCLEGIKLASGSIRSVYDDGTNLERREDMAMAALYSGLALANAGLGAAHGLAGPLGGLLGAPHGALCARLIGPVIQVNWEAMLDREPSNPAIERYLDISQVVGFSERDDDRNLTTWVNHLTEDLRIPRLVDMGLERADITEVIDQAKRASSMKANPIRLDEAEISRILEMAY